MTTEERLMTVANNIEEMNERVNTEAELIAEIQDIVDNIPCDERGGYDDGFEAGEKSEYDRFWDAFQIDNKGNPRTDYNYAFYTTTGVGWNANNFKPKYDLKPTLAQNMFYQFSSGKAASFVEMLEQAGVTLDTSNCTNCNRMFYQSPITDVPHLDLSKCTTVQYLFCNCFYLKSAEITMAENTASTYDRMIYECKALEDLTINGTIDKSLDLSSCTKLTRASIDSVLTAASMTLTTTQTLTFSTAAVNAAYTTEDWEVLVGMFSSANWSLVLA